MGKLGRKKTFFLNTLVMTGGALILRFTNIAFRAWVFTHLGAKGVGEYQLLMTIFYLAVTACTSGLGFAITRTIAEGVGGRRQLRLCTGVAVSLSLVAGSALWLAAPWLASTVLGGAETLVPLRLLCFGLPLMAVSACLKGYFLAIRNSVLPALAELLELFSTIGLVVWLFSATQPLVALCLGATLGELLSCTLLTICYLLVARRNRLPQDGGASHRLLLHIAAPVFVGSFARSGLSSVENLLIPHGLGLFGGGQSAALAQYGTVTGMVMPVLFLPICILTSAAMLLIPELAEMNAKGRGRAIENAARKAIELTLWFSFLTAAVVIFFSDAVGVYFFKSEQAGQFLRIMAPIIPILYLDSVVDGMLKGLDQQLYSFRYNLMDGVLRVAMAAVLLPRFGVSGYFMLLFASEIFNAGLSLNRLIKVTRVQVDAVWWLVAPMAAATTLYLLLRLSKNALIGL